ncbi:tyrosine recombinase XerC [Candidatus Dependentiae bacterium Noda2021]|nr:tyrosine recombinase XerC [Candidatus Dependentiae bacterium Noda2021]
MELLEQQHSVTNQTSVLLNQLLEQFIASQDITQTSRVSYRNALKQFFTWLESACPLSPNRQTILAYKESLDVKGLRPFTRSAYLVVVRKFFEWTETLKLYPNIARGIKGAKKQVKSHQKNALTIDQIKLLLGSIERSTITGKRDYALINLLIRTGLRLIEIKRSDIGDITHETDRLLWIRGKARDGKDDFVLLTNQAYEPIQEYIKARTNITLKSPLFSSLSDRNYGRRLTIHSLSRIIKQRLRGVGIDSTRVTAHSLRHTFGVMSMQAGASLYEVQLAMRHTAPTTTEVYLGDIEKLKRIQAAPERKLNDFLSSNNI